MAAVLLHKYFRVTVLLFLLPAVTCLQVSAGTDAAAPSPHKEIAELIDNGGYAVTKESKYVAAHHLHTPYVPASVIKIATALAALEVLGPAFRFQTRFYRDDRSNLYIKGYGDPFLVSEEVRLIMKKFKELGLTEINDIYLDDTLFDLERPADGSGPSTNPFDARNSALAVNFNTINIEIGADGVVVSAEPQTPTLAIMSEVGRGLPPGVHRINIGSTRETGRAFQQQEQITGTGIIASRKTPADLKPYYIHHSSKTLQDIIGPLMLFSNNFIANQLFLAVGAERSGFPATWQKSIQVMTDLLEQKCDIPAGELKIFEGSGLSRKNLVTPYAMIQLLDAFKPYARLLPEQDASFLKSGTLQGVYSYAGYFVENNRLDSFVLLLNQQKNTRDRLLDELEQVYQGN